jgi:hypothetical protein
MFFIINRVCVLCHERLCIHLVLLRRVFWIASSQDFPFFLSLQSRVYLEIIHSLYLAASINL